MKLAQQYPRKSPDFYRKNDEVLQKVLESDLDLDFEGPITLMECIHGPIQDFGYTTLFQEVSDFRNKVVLWCFLEEWDITKYYNKDMHDRMVHYINLCSPVKKKELKRLVTGWTPTNYCNICHTLKKKCKI